jgi:hypothetical protein
MKITNDDLHIHGSSVDKTAKSSQNPQSDFNSILQGTLGTSTATENGVEPPALVETVVPGQLQHVRSPDKPSTIDRIEKVLDILDEYRRKLADPNTTLREIEPLVKSLETENGQLQPVLNSIVEGDQLKDILNQTLVSTSLEVIKYNKGDYI